MADLSTLDELAPGAAELVSLGDDRIRETRAAVKGSFGGIDLGAGTAVAEHYLKGFHKFPNGVAAGRPAAGNIGRIYLNTENSWIEYDTGANLDQLGAMGTSVGTIAASTVINTAYTNVYTATVTTRANSRLILLASLTTIMSGGTNDFKGTFYVNGVSRSFGDAWSTVPSGGFGNISMVNTNVPALSNGDQTIEVRALKNTAVGTLLTWDGYVVVLVI